MTQSETDFSAFDDSLFDGIVQEATNYVDAAGGTNDFNSLFYLDEGKIELRLYPEVYTDAEGKKKLRIVRVIRTHQIPGVGRIACNGEGCRFCAETKKLYQIKYKEAYKTAAKDEGIVVGYAYSTTMDTKYVKLETPSYIVMRRKPLIALQQWLSGLDRDDLRAVFNPNKASASIDITITKGDNSNASIGLSPKQRELPPLPDTFEEGGLGKVYYDESDPKFGTEEDLMKYKKYVAEIVANKTNLISPESGGGSRSSEPEPSRPSAAKSNANSAGRVADILGEGKSDEPASSAPASNADDGPAEEGAVTVERQTAQRKPSAEAKKEEKQAESKKTIEIKKESTSVKDRYECPGKSTVPELDFGKYNPDETECVICPLETKCQAYTEKLAAGAD
jgi:hypothetical protein